MCNVNCRIDTYLKNECITFRKINDAYGGLSNMSKGYPIEIEGEIFTRSEQLYQAFRFSDHINIQRDIQNEDNQFKAKLISKKYRDKHTRNDWDDVRVDIMDLCIRMKLKCNWQSFGDLLLETEDKNIVEDSHRDRFWGCVKDKNEQFIGSNVLGKLLMKLRGELKEGKVSRDNLCLPRIVNLRLFGKTVDY